MTTSTTKCKRSSKNKPSREDIYSRVTNRIIEQLEQGVRPWIKPWNAEHAAGRITRPLRHNGVAYNGINILMLWDSAETQGFAAPLWLTYKQAQELGGHVTKGEKGTPVVYASSFKKTEKEDDGNEVEQDIPFLKQYTVFNVGNAKVYLIIFTSSSKSLENSCNPSTVLKSSSPTPRQIFEKAAPKLTTQLAKILFECHICKPSAMHKATHPHWLCHWTRHPSRLNRDLGRKRWGDAGYAAEELVAEMGAAFLCADLRITPGVRDDHAAYIESWLTVLKNDKRAIFIAASQASKAVEYLHELQPA